MSAMIPTVRPGRFHPLGATYDGHGVNFALFSEHAAAVELCLFDEKGAETRVFLPERSLHVWHGYVPGIAPGARYGYRVHGRYAPREGDRFNPAKLLVDPYAKCIFGKVDYRAPVYGYARTPVADDGSPDPADSAWGVPKGVVCDNHPFDWRGDARLEIPWPDTILYEAHVKGFTKRMPGVPEALRGTYLGLVTPPAIAYLKALGVTAIELLPVHECMTEDHVAARGLTNYWGYSTLGFFAPDQRLASRPGNQVDEFKEMVRVLHSEGFEVILDVVYNHSCEGGHDGPTVSLRGIDNRSYYHLKVDSLDRYQDFTGCGNSLNMHHPQSLKLVMDSLRYWVNDMHVDGFRFDLASTLARELHAVDKLSAFFDIIHQDPTISQVKLIAEPWDLGEGGYQVGNFPVLWTEWNGRFRDTVRRFFIGSLGTVGELASRLTGSSDLYEDDGRHPHASINFVTAHDGFTLRDLVSYAHKHNLANGEGNRDGSDDNSSENSGVEGETSDRAIVALRLRQMRNFMAVLFLSQGVPMLTSGDELGKTQGGNNNPYCLDSEISWIDWTLDDDQRTFLQFVKDLIAFRKAHPNLRRKEFFVGERVRGSRLKDLAWFRHDGAEMKLTDWERPTMAYLAMLLSGDAMSGLAEGGLPMCDETFLILMSGESMPTTVRLPEAMWGDTWEVVVDTTRSTFGSDGVHGGGDPVTLAPRQLVLMRRMLPVSGSWRAPP